MEVVDEGAHVPGQVIAEDRGQLRREERHGLSHGKESTRARAVSWPRMAVETQGKGGVFAAKGKAKAVAS